MESILEICKKLYSKLIRVRNNRIIFWDGTPNSGSNIKILYDYFTQYYPEYDSIYFTRSQYVGNLKKYITLVSSARVIVTSHGCSNLKKSQTYFELWHGVPLKKMGYLINEGKIAFADKFISSSETYSTLLNACIGTRSEYLLTGFPRNDYFSKERALSKVILDEFGFGNGKNIIFMPTYRKGLGKVQSDLDRSVNPFGFEGLSVGEINQFLAEKNINIIMKLHPAEEALYLDVISGLSNIKIVSQKKLMENNLDIYQLLAHSDALITDYSSVYFDYLITNKPIIFLFNDIEQYEKNRGFLVEPVDFWTPGEKVKSYEDFINCINSFNEGIDKYYNNRSIVTDIIHHYKDTNSCKRVCEELVKELKRKK